MPRSTNYYDNYVNNGGANGSTLPVAQPTAQPDIVVPPPQPPAPRSPNDAATIEASKERPLFFGYPGNEDWFSKSLREMGNDPNNPPIDPNLPPEEQLRQNFQQASHNARRNTWNILKALPGNILKAPLQIGYSALEGIDSASQFVFGTKPFMPAEYDTARLNPTATWGTDPIGTIFNKTHLLGTLTGFKQPYQEAKKLTSGDAMGKFIAAVVSTGKVAGDAAITADMATTIQGTFKPQLVTVKGKVTGPDFRPLTQTQMSEIKSTLKPIVNEKGQLFVPKETPVTFEQKPTASFFKIPESAAAKYGGDSSNTFLRVAPAGEGTAEFSVVQLRSSAVSRGIDWMKSKFGKANVMPTEMGPAVKVDSGLIQYNPGAITAAGDSLPEFLAPGVATPPEIAMGGTAAVTRASMDAIQKTLNPTETLKVDNSLPEGYYRVADEAYKNAVNNGGVTINLQGNQPAEGYAYSPYKDSETVIPKEQFTPEHVTQFMTNNADRLAQDGNHIGIWEDNGKIYLDVSQVGAPTPETLTKAEQAGQLAVFDLKNFETINTKLYGQEISGSNLNQGQVPGTSGAGSPVSAGELQPSATIPDFLQPTAGAGEVAAVYPADIKAAAKFDLANKAGAEELGIQYPSPVSRPLKGFEDAPITEKQIGQINFMKGQRELDDQMLQTISAVLTGKGNISDLTQKEAFEVSETIRMFNKKAAELPGERDMFLRPFINPARYWMEAAERQLGYPLYSQAYIPVETGARLAKVLQQELGQQSREVFGKYADPTKFLEERRLLTSYIEGDKAVITNNTALDAQTKADLVKIGDWLTDKFKDLFSHAGIKSNRFFGQYAPKIRQLGTIYNLYKNTDLPAELRPFFTFERGGMDEPIEDDALVLYDIYTRAFSRDKFMRGPVEQAKDLTQKLPEGLQKSLNDYIQEKLGYQGKPEQALNRWGMKLSTATNGAVPADIFRRAINFLMTNSYAATLGLPRVVPIFANLMQSFLMSYPELGPKYFTEGWKSFLQKGGLEEFNKSGFSREKGSIYGGELASEASKGKVGKAFDLYQNAQNLTLVPFGKTDVLNAGVTYFGVKQRFQDFWQAFRDGKITYDQFEKGISMDGFNPTLQKILRQKFAENTRQSLQDAQDLMIQDVLDSTQFPYRKAAESRAFYGLKGKFGLQYGIWPFEYAHTIKGWISRGQWGKLLRWYSMATLLDRSSKDALGVDMSRYLLLGPLAAVPMGPLANAAYSFTQMLNASFQDMSEQQDQYAGQVYDALKNYGGSLFGVGAQRLKHFYTSVERKEAGLNPSTDPDPQKQFGIYSSAGKLKQWVTFGDLLKYTFGFNNTETTDLNDRTNMVRKETLKYNSKMDEAMNALVDGNFKKFDKIVTDNQLQIGDISAKLQSYQTPLDQRLFDKMPAPLKAKYIQVFYPAQ